jgi:DNA-binding FadR family transcriptional regulator
MARQTGVRVPKAAEIVAAKLRRTIVDGTLTPGDMLPSEARMIEDFGVSRPTIREAIRILEFENLIVVTRGARGGAKVQPHTPAFVSRAVGVALQADNAMLGDIFAARQVIEPAAAAMAAKSRPKEIGEILAAHVEKERQMLSSKHRDYTELVADFHRLLLQECGNKTFGLLGVALHEVVLRHLKLYGQTGTPRRINENLSVGIRSRKKLVDLIAAGDAEAAEAHWQRHMKRIAELILPGLDKTSVVDALDETSWT